MNMLIYLHHKLLFLFLFLFMLMGFDIQGQNELLPDTMRFCQVDSAYIQVYDGYHAFLWNTGDTTQGIWAINPGVYSVSATKDSIDYLNSTFLIILDAKIFQDDTLLTCGDTLAVFGNNDLYSYFWLPDDTIADTLRIYPRTKTMYYATISDTLQNFNYCMDSVEIDVDPIIAMDTVIQSAMGCPGEGKAQIRVEASGGYPPYMYDWPAEALPSPGDSAFAIGLSDGTKNIVITDSIGCVLDYDFEVKAYPIPELVLSTVPMDTVFLQNPNVSFTYENPQYDSLGVDTFYVSWWEWNFGDSSKSTIFDPTYAYKKTGTMNILLKFKTFYNCPGSDSITIEVKPVHFFVSGIITPNNDDANDRFEVWYDEGGGGGTNPAFKSDTRDPIDLNKYYLSNTLILFNRWGEKIFETDNYENDWMPDGLPDGTYFYLLKCVGEYDTDIYKGSFMIFNQSAN